MFLKMNTIPLRWGRISSNYYNAKQRLTETFLNTKLKQCRINCTVLGRRHFSNARPKSNSHFAYPEGMIDYEDDYVEQPEYPEIDEETHTWTEAQKDKRQAALDWHKKIQDQPNPEAKTLEINMPRYYGWRSMMLTENRFDYDSEDLYRFITRTELIEDTLPEVYSSANLDKEAKHFAEKLRQPILDAINFELNDQCRTFDTLGESSPSIDFKRSQTLLTQINRIILSILGSEVEHLNTCQVDIVPKIESFWFIGGQQPSKIEKSARRGQNKFYEKQKSSRAIRVEEGDPVERAIQYKGSPLLQIRCDQPLPNFVDDNSAHCRLKPDSPLVFPYTLHHFGVHKQYNYASIIPGTWTGDSHRCSHIAFHPRHHLLDELVQASEHWKADYENTLSSQAILASFGRLLAQALYFGFDQFSDLKYPFSGQTIITDGLKWSFSAYQLNTIKLSDLFLAKNTKQNICWKLKTMSIMDEVDPKKLNKDTLEAILKFYLNRPTLIADENPTPYLKEPLKQMRDEIQKEILFYNYRDMVSQRWYRFDTLLKRQFPETYEWEWIYKIHHKQRFMEPRRRFFELPFGFPGSQPYNTPYKLLDPRRVRKRMRFLMAEVAARKEQERIEEAKRAESAKYGIVEQPAKRTK